MISIAMFIQILTTIFCTTISGVVLFLFQQSRKHQEHDRENKVTADVCERELILSMAGAIEIIMRKQNDEELNGEMKAAQADLEDKKRALQKLTRVVYFEETD